jgi:hypothetical protein
LVEDGAPHSCLIAKNMKLGAQWRLGGAGTEEYFTGLKITP